MPKTNWPMGIYMHRAVLLFPNSKTRRPSQSLMTHLTALLWHVFVDQYQVTNSVSWRSVCFIEIELLSGLGGFDAFFSVLWALKWSLAAATRCSKASSERDLLSAPTGNVDFISCHGSFPNAMKNDLFSILLWLTVWYAMRIRSM